MAFIYRCFDISLIVITPSVQVKEKCNVLTTETTDEILNFQREKSESSLTKCYTVRKPPHKN